MSVILFFDIDYHNGRETVMILIVIVDLLVVIIVLLFVTFLVVFA